MDNMNCKHCNKKLKVFTKTTDWSTRKYHATCWRKHMDLLEKKYMVVDHEEKAEIFMKVEAAKLRILKQNYPISWKYMARDVVTPLWQAPCLL